MTFTNFHKKSRKMKNNLTVLVEMRTVELDAKLVEKRKQKF